MVFLKNIFLLFYIVFTCFIKKVLKNNYTNTCRMIKNKTLDI